MPSWKASCRLVASWNASSVIVFLSGMGPQAGTAAAEASSDDANNNDNNVGAAAAADASPVVDLAITQSWR